MSLTIPDLLAKLQIVDQNAQVAMYVNRRISAIHEIVCAAGSPYVFLCEKARPSSPRTYTESENGLIGYCAANGISDEIAAKLLGRTADKIERQRKKLGF